MLNVLVKDTNEVVGFPDTTDKHIIKSVIDDEINGTITQAKPNWYRDKVQPALEATGMDMFQPKFLGAKVEPDATRAFVTNYAKDASFGAFENKNPDVVNLNAESKAQHPIAAMAGSLAGQLQAIVMTAGLGEAFGLGKVAEAGAKVAGKVGANVASGAGVGALYGGITSSVKEINKSIDENDYPDIVKIGQGALKDAGIFALYGVPGSISSFPVATAAIAGTAYSISKLEGAKEEDALLNAAVMGISHAVNAGSQTKEVLDQHQEALDKVKADYIKSMNPAIHDATVDRTAQEHTMMMKDALDEKIELNTAGQRVDGQPITVGEMPKQEPIEKQLINNQINEILNVKPQEGKPLTPEVNQNKPVEISEKLNAGDTLTTEMRDNLAKKTKEAIDKKQPVWMETEGKKIPIVDVVNGMYVDSKGQKWGSMDFFAGGRKLFTEESQPKGTTNEETKTQASGKEVLSDTQTTKVSREQLPVGTGEEKASGLEARVKQTLESAPEHVREQISNYKEMNKQEQLKAASQYVTENPEEALAVLKGEKSAPEGLLHNSIALALEHRASNANDANLILKLASLRSTRAGQEISMLTERDPNSPITYIDELQQRKIESLGEKEAAKKVRENETAKVRKYIKKPAKGDWTAFIESIKC